MAPKRPSSIGASGWSVRGAAVVSSALVIGWFEIFWRHCL
jgi:hypothetical protein